MITRISHLTTSFHILLHVETTSISHVITYDHINFTCDNISFTCYHVVLENVMRGFSKGNLPAANVFWQSDIKKKRHDIQELASVTQASSERKRRTSQATSWHY